MKRKNIIIKLLSLVLAVFVVTTVAFAEENSKPYGMKGGRFGFVRNGEAGLIKSNGEFTASIKEKIADLDEGDVKEQLSALLDEYSDLSSEVKAVIESEQTKELIKKYREAEQKLHTALKEANIIKGFENRNKNEGVFPFRLRLDIDTNKLTEAVNALGDENVKTKLNDLIKSYEECCKACENNNITDKEQQKTLRNNADKALKELINALKEADIDVKDFVNGDIKKDKKPEGGKAIKEKHQKSAPEKQQNKIKTSASESVAVNNEQNSKTIAENIIDWLKNIG